MLSAVQFVDKQLANRSLEEEKKAKKKEKKKEKKVRVAPLSIQCCKFQPSMTVDANKCPV